jgi:hypothetical protein
MTTLNELLAQAQANPPRVWTAAEVAQEEARLRSDLNVKAGQVYRHYKGGLYQIITWARHSETKELMIVYGDVGGENIWVRPARMWGETVSPGVQRFTLLWAHPPIMDTKYLIALAETPESTFWIRFVIHVFIAMSVTALLVWAIWRWFHV